jgi:hypothetical protein
MCPVFGAPRTYGCPETVLFEAGVDALLGKQNLNDSRMSRIRDSGQARVFGQDLPDTAKGRRLRAPLKRVIEFLGEEDLART